MRAERTRDGVVRGEGPVRARVVAICAAVLVALVGVALATTWWSLLALVYVAPAARAARIVRSGAGGPGLIPVLQLTGVAELVYGLGLLVGLAVGG